VGVAEDETVVETDLRRGGEIVGVVVVPQQPPMTFVNVTFSCYELYQTSGLGTGNYIMAFYALRLAARRLGNIDIVMSCHSTNAN
jgi:hypothetical protein